MPLQHWVLTPRPSGDSMLPVGLDLTSLPLLLIGNGPRTLDRLALLQRAGAQHITLYSPSPEPALTEQSEITLHHGLPDDEMLTQAGAVMIVDLPQDEAAELAKRCRAVRTLVNVEDVKDLCDFYFVSEVRRGDLVLAISTSGASPALAVRIREHLEAEFGPEWAEFTARLGEQRKQWMAEGLRFEELSARSRRMIDESGLLPPSKESDAA